MPRPLPAAVIARFLQTDPSVLNDLERAYFDEFHAVNPDTTPVQMDRKIRLAKKMASFVDTSEAGMVR